MDNKNKRVVNIVGAGLSGLSAAITLSRLGISSRLISSQPSERAQSVLAEGGINASLDTMGEADTIDEHFADTMIGGCRLESESAVRNLTSNAPEIVNELFRLGVPLQNDNGRIILRNFGGQKKKRTAYAKSSTGKMIMTALIDEVRKYEAMGLVERFPHHELVGMKTENNTLSCILVADTFTKEICSFSGCTILCTGGLNGFFEGMTTGTTQNTGNAAAIAFNAGVKFANLEFIQFHPTTVGISDKRMLISEAARGEGGRLYINRNNSPWYFMEEKYPELGNLMPRDIVSREMYFVKHSPQCSGDVFLDMTGLNDSIWKTKLSDLRSEIIAYLQIDPAKNPVAVSPGIHFFMGGIYVNNRHETNIHGLLAAGEAACKYHGANRLGGNSMLGAIFGGKTAAETVSEYHLSSESQRLSAIYSFDSSFEIRCRIKDILLKGMSIVRDESSMKKMLDTLEEIQRSEKLSEIDRMRLQLSIAMAKSALNRKESRGAHYRSDYPDEDDNFRKLTVVSFNGGEIKVKLVPAESVEA